MTTVLLLGFLVGMQHALEADHVAAVASIAARRSTVRQVVRHGAVWGLGHSVTLMAVAGAAVVLNWTIGEQLALWLEAAVGGMLVLLGGHVIYRLIHDRIHFHVHRHVDGVTHFHAHSHAGEPVDHARSDHRHRHQSGLPLRSFLVGIMHGLAGSAALVILTAAAIDTPVLGFLYVVLFGIGSVLGMAMLSALIAVPLSYSARFLTWANRLIQASVGGATIVLGMYVLTRTAGNLSPLL